MGEREYLNAISELAEDGMHRKTIAAVRIILGGLDTQGYWGFSFSAFARRFETRLKSYLPDPESVHLDLMPGFNALRDFLDSRLDHVSDPAHNFTIESAIQSSAAATVLGLVGDHGSGRTTLADHLVDSLGFTRVSFDDPVRIAASVLYNIPLHYLSDPKLALTRIESLKSTPRRVMDIIAGEVCQGLRRSIWSDRLMLRVAGVARMSEGATPKVVVNGLRFKDEADHVRSLEHGQVAWVTRGSASQTLRPSAALPGDVVLHNDRDSASFVAKAVESLGLLQDRPATTDLSPAPVAEPRTIAFCP